MGSGIDRREILRRDCPKCHANGYLLRPGTGEEYPCDYPGCDGSGTLELDVPFKFDGQRGPDELADMWETEMASREGREPRPVSVQRPARRNPEDDLGGVV